MRSSIPPAPSPDNGAGLSRGVIGLIASSGEGGAKLHRRKRGEQLENLAASGEHHWMAGNFLRYAGPLPWTTCRSTPTS